MATISSEYVVTLTDKINIWCRTYGLTADAVSNYWSSKLESSPCGGGLWQVGSKGAGSNWVDSPPLYWKGEDYIKALQLRFNILPTRGGLHNRGGDVLCRAGCHRRETVCHILQACPVTHYDRIKRHDRIVKKLADYARDGGLTVEIEPRIRDTGGFLHKPDLILIKGNAVLITDVAVHWEGPDVLAVSAQHKVARYSGRAFLTAVSARYPDSTVTMSPFVLGARGGWCSTNNAVVDFIKIGRARIDALVSSALKGGWLTHSAFSARVWAAH